MSFTTFLVIFCSLFEAVVIFHLLRSFLLFCRVFVQSFWAHLCSFSIFCCCFFSFHQGNMVSNAPTQSVQHNAVKKIKFHVTSLSVLKVTSWVTPTHTKIDQRCCFLLNISPIRTCEIAILKCQVQPHHLKWTQNNQVPFISRLLWARRDIGSAFLHFAAFLHKCDVGYASEHSRGRKVCRSKEWKVSHNPPSCYSARDRKSI